MDYMPEKVYEKRTQYAGGASERGNGFAVWRRLFRDNAGGGDLVEYAGVDVLRTYPQCHSIRNLSNHLDGWQELFDTYGSELAAAPRMLRSMIMNIIPKELKTEIMKEKSLVGADYRRIISWCRERSTILQSESMAELTKKSLSRTYGKVHSVSRSRKADEDEPDQELPHEEAPAWAQAMQDSFTQAMNAIKSGVPPPPNPHAAKRPPRKESPAGRGRPTDRRPSPGSGSRRDPRGRSNSQGRRPSRSPLRLVGWDKRCDHCGRDDHRRENCDDFNKMMKDHNGSKPKKDWRPPPGYKSALAKARDAEKAKNAKDKDKSRKIHAVAPEGEDSASEDDFDGYSDAGHPARFSVGNNKGALPVRAMRPMPPVKSVCSINTFQGLDEDAQEYDLEVLEALNEWSDKVYIKPSRKQSQAQKKLKSLIDRQTRYIISNKKPAILDQETLVVTNSKQAAKVSSKIAALPKNRKDIAKTVKKLPKIELKPDERLVLVDSGSFDHAIDAETEVPDHEVLPPTDDSIDGQTACGGILKNKGSVIINAEIDNEDVTIKYSNMKTNVPILSVQQLVRDLNDVIFKNGGGYIKNRRSGKRLNFFEHGGVYYLIMKIRPPTKSEKSDFHRPGTA